MMHHELKILPCYFKAVMSGDKRFEIRNDADGGFQKGDSIALIEHQPDAIQQTGSGVTARITYVTGYNQPQNQVVFGFEVIGEFCA